MTGARVALRPVDGVRVTTLIDNSSDVLLPDVGLVRRWGMAGSGGRPGVVPSSVAAGGATLDFLRAEHGFAALVEVRAGGRTRSILFDAGSSPDGLVANLDRLGIPADRFEAIVLSHGHFDHVMGLEGLVGRVGRVGMPILLHPDAWTRRRIYSPSGSVELPTPSRTALEGAGFAIVDERKPSFLLDEFLLVSGEVVRTTEFETGMAPSHQAWRNGAWEPDPLVHDDQAVVLDVAGKGLVVITGCGHAGIVNVLRHAKALTGVDRIHAVLGGLHLRDGPVVARTVEELAAESPTVVVGAHCTSWWAQHALAAALPGAFQPNSVGSTVEL